MMSDSAVQKFVEQKLEIEQRTLERTKESLRILDDTEKCGIATAEQLVHQGEQLQKIDQDLDEINNLLEESQKNINGIKSMFGGLRKRLFGNKNKTDVNAGDPKDNLKESKVGKSGLQEKVNEFTQNCTPPLRHQKTVTEPNGTDFDSQFKGNMNGISASILRLKGLANDMGDELGSHNNLIKKINDKTDIEVVKMEQQNKQMKKLVGK